MQLNKIICLNGLKFLASFWYDYQFDENKFISYYEVVNYLSDEKFKILIKWLTENWKPEFGQKMPYPIDIQNAIKKYNIYKNTESSVPKPKKGEEHLVDGDYGDDIKNIVKNIAKKKINRSRNNNENYDTNIFNENGQFTKEYIMNRRKRIEKLNTKK